MDEVLTSLFKYYKYSSLRSDTLSEVQKLLGNGIGTTIKRASHTRWLSHENALNSIRVNYQALLLDLENAVVSGQSRVVTGSSGPTAESLLKHLKSYDFFQLIHFLCDVLSVVSKLTLIFERRDIDLSIVEGHLSATLDSLKKLKKKPGGLHCRKIDERARKIGILAPVAQSYGKFRSDARALVDTLVENLSKRLENIPIITQLSVLDLQQANPTVLSLYGVTEMMALAEFYELDEDNLLTEWEDFKSVFYSNAHDYESLSIVNLGNILHKAEKSIGQRFPHIQKLLAITTTPMSTADVERVFSQVKLILTDHRNRLKVEHVNLILCIKLNEELDFKKAVKHWMEMRNRRLFM